jgi:peptidoglycan/LPS O-acetylase OafA/YrhL
VPASDLLLAISQLAVALAGFSGLIAAIRTAAPDGWYPRDIWSLSWMLGTSIGALVLSLLPLWLDLLAWPDEAVYRVSSAVASVAIGGFVAVMVWTGRRLTRAGHPPRVRYFPATIVFLLGLASIVMAAGAAGGLDESIVAAYVGALIALLLASVLVLAVFLVLLARMTQRRS